MDRKKLVAKLFLKKDIIAPSTFLAVYIALLLTGVYSHEMWRDELQAWSIARDSSNLLELYNNLRYEGTPGLWHLLLFTASRLTRSPIAMQIIHVLLAFTANFLLLFKTRLPFFIKSLYCINYFSVYEYGVISRNYVLTVLFSILIATELTEEEPNLVKTAFFLFGLSFTSVLALFICVSFIIYIVLDGIEKDGINRKLLHKLKIPLTLALLSIATSYLTSVPPKDMAQNQLFRTYYDRKLILETVSTIWNAYVPIPIERVNFWSSNIIPHLYLKFQYSVFLFVLLALLFFTKPKVGIFYVCGTFLLLSFFYIKYSGAIRHWGNLYLILLVSTILYFSKPSAKTVGLNKIIHLGLYITIVLVLLCQSFALFRAMKLEILYQFSAGRSVANIIKSYNTNHYIIADNQVWVSSVGFFLDEPTYSVKFDQELTFIKWVVETQTNQENPEKVIQAAYRIQNQKPDTKILLVTSYFFGDSAPVKLLHTSGPTIALKRPINIYELKKE